MGWAGDGVRQPKTKEMSEGGKVKLMVGKMAWCHALMLLVKQMWCFLLMGFH